MDFMKKKIIMQKKYAKQKSLHKYFGHIEFSGEKTVNEMDPNAEKSQQAYGK